MTGLKLYDSQTRAVRPFTPLDPAHVGMYVCGITPYDHAHIGHARVAVVFDVLYRLLRHQYGEDHVRYIRNFTDIDDKIITRAAETNQQPTALAQTFIDSYHADMQALNCLPPTAEPRVSDPAVLEGIAAHIDRLIDAGFAYVVPSGDVIYRTARFPTFGQLAQRKLEEQQAGARVAVDDEKESPHDFVLWKAEAKSTAKLAESFDPATLGATRFTAKGRPGWHIECSVMSEQNLGTPFDLHGGGEDLKFPHHCCEIAQTEALLTPNTTMANHWLHVAFVTVGGTKMSKSLGNFTTLKDALARYSPEAIRLWLLQTHYRKPVDFTDEALAAAQTTATNLYDIWTHSFTIAIDQQQDNFDHPGADLKPFHLALCDDLNTSVALAEMHKTAKKLASAKTEQEIRYWRPRFAYMVNHLGLLQQPPAGYFKPEDSPLTDAELALFDARHDARAAKNWAESDHLRAELLALGITVEDHKDGTTTWRRL